MDASENFRRAQSRKPFESHEAGVSHAWQRMLNNDQAYTAR